MMDNNKVSVAADDVFAAHDALARALALTPQMNETSWQLLAYAAGCAAIAGAAGWTLDELLKLRYDAYIHESDMTKHADMIAAGTACKRSMQAVLDGFGFVLGHEDSHGAFQLEYVPDDKRIKDIHNEWLADATIVI